MVTSADRLMLSKLRVLVVDDQDMLALLVPFLQELDVRNIYRATDGVAAIEQMNTVRRGVQMVICDWDIPKQNGLDVLKYVRKNFLDIPFVMLAAHVTAEAIATARVEGVTEYLAKPFNVVTLQERVIAAARSYYGSKPSLTEVPLMATPTLDTETATPGTPDKNPETEDDAWEI